MTKLITFVCTGNICRSTMGEQVARARASELGTQARFDSAGISDEEEGNPIDPRAARTLRAHGYPVGDHRAKQVTRALIESSDLVLAFEPVQLNRMKRLAPDAENICLVTDFHPAGATGSGIEDPWYYGQEAFEQTLEAIEEAMPGLFRMITEQAAR
ncbi:low molecular weight protein-tyrosine-phosphatase [Propionimicrobium sp. PCR01-08-3]|uniref:low molecular weight protein-tyrosine-phosphatase n=1 Tax=Propionimicrobium sp. PCR01-08-3 TaxID=3052086 RepID=UPI00255C57B1|nr:low molecular weight protein-tyrosine-phosphatase [Propionimicrobium sp. PCR01-08-3]WIY82686.1 low molecular weight protein-tyrosine-phosphatase [Propionimicrobium sp. PCR01-08-3]